MNWKLKPRREVEVLLNLPPDVAYYLQRKAVNSDGARALLMKYGHPLPEEISRKRTAPERIAVLPMAVEPCPKCMSLNTRPLAGRVLIHGRQAWYCDDCEHRWGVGQVSSGAVI